MDIDIESTEAFEFLLRHLWQINRASCKCGGLFAWSRPASSGAFISVGCICHTQAELLVADYFPVTYVKTWLRLHRENRLNLRRDLKEALLDASSAAKNLLA